VGHPTRMCASCRIDLYNDGRRRAVADRWGRGHHGYPLPPPVERRKPGRGATASVGSSGSFVGVVADVLGRRGAARCPGRGANSDPRSGVLDTIRENHVLRSGGSPSWNISSKLSLRWANGFSTWRTTNRWFGSARCSASIIWACTAVGRPTGSRMWRVPVASPEAARTSASSARELSSRGLPRSRSTAPPAVRRTPTGSRCRSGAWPPSPARPACDGPKIGSPLARRRSLLK
jgi:hypothetical protein